MNYLTVRDVSEKLHLGLNNTYRLFKLKGFPHIRVGNKYLVEENDLICFLKNYQGVKIYLAKW